MSACLSDEYQWVIFSSSLRSGYSIEISTAGAGESGGNSMHLYDL